MVGALLTVCTEAFIFKDTSQGAQDDCYHLLYQQQLLPGHAETFFQFKLISKEFVFIRPQKALQIA